MGKASIYSTIYGIAGSGGFAREVMPVACAMLMQQGIDKEQLVFVDNEMTDDCLNGHPVLTEKEFFDCDVKNHYFNIAIAESSKREKIANYFLSKGALPFSIRCHSSMSQSNNQIDVGAILAPYTIITVNAKIGKFFHLNIYSYVAHDCIIGDFVTFAPQVQCNGGVIIEDHVYIGTGAIIRNSTPSKEITIGRGAIIGMGAVVTKSVPAGVTVAGNPAAILGKP